MHNSQCEAHTHVQLGNVLVRLNRMQSSSTSLVTSPWLCARSHHSCVSTLQSTPHCAPPKPTNEQTNNQAPYTSSFPSAPSALPPLLPTSQNSLLPRMR